MCFQQAGINDTLSPSNQDLMENIANDVGELKRLGNEEVTHMLKGEEKEKFDAMNAAVENNLAFTDGNTGTKSEQTLASLRKSMNDLSLIVENMCSKTKDKRERAILIRYTDLVQKVLQNLSKLDEKDF